ncbi:hypothetical protein [Rhodoferax sp. GW822-FHT02A01]|uniref:hypothetical protein n=1 Tax=Rhodoferax sp. GW822-FHT02A01 TaxID=3141537 RepID=UPI00315C5B18
MSDAMSVEPPSIQAYDLFNGDADGIYALHQLRMAQACDSQWLTCVKRNIALYQKLPTNVALSVTALDISFARNEVGLRQVLGFGGRLRYFDHHAEEKRFAHPRLECYIDCTRDNLPAQAVRLARNSGCSAGNRSARDQLGRLRNYNAYRVTTTELHIHPVDQCRSVHRFEDPQDFFARSSEFGHLREGFAEDHQLPNALAPFAQTVLADVYVLPDTGWTRLLSGTLANQLTSTDSSKSFAVLPPCSSDTYVVSIRTSAASRARTDLFCHCYAGGGGRHAAGGIDHTPASDLGRIIATSINISREIAHEYFPTQHCATTPAFNDSAASLW